MATKTAGVVVHVGRTRIHEALAAAADVFLQHPVDSITITISRLKGGTWLDDLKDLAPGLAEAMRTVPYRIHPARFAVHPGRHGAAQIARLYGLQSHEWFHWDHRNPQAIRGRRDENYIHLHVLGEPEEYTRAAALIHAERINHAIAPAVPKPKRNTRKAVKR
jgi:hypothetical protein